MLKKCQRQVQIMDLLSKNQKGMTISELCRALKRLGYNITERTIRRDILDLIPIFHITTYGKENAPTYQVSGVHIDYMSLCFEDMQAFHLLREMSRPYLHLEIGQYMNIFLEKLQAAIPEEQKEWLKRTSDVLTVNPGYLQDERNIPIEIRNTIEEGIVTHHCVRIKYVAFSSNTISERLIEPMLLEFHEGCHHIWAYCHERKAIRDFRLSRIQSTQLTDVEFIPRKKLLYIAMKNRFESMSAPESVDILLRFRGFAARYVKEYHFSKADNITIELDGSILFKMKTGLTDDVVRWVLGFGADVEVLEPDVFRERLSKIVLNMMKLYSKKEHP